MKVAVVTDSTAYIPSNIREKLDIHMAPLSVIFGDSSYREEMDLNTKDFYMMVRDAVELPKTSQPSIGFVTELYQKLAEDHDAIISIHLSSGISGTYQTALSAGQMVDGVDVYAFDSEISCMPQGFYVLEAAEMAQNGASPEQIIDRLNEMKQSMRAYFMVDDLSHLKRGGRLNGAQAFVGSMLQVKPLLHFVDTKIVPFEKIRTRKKALNRLKSLFAEDADLGKPMKAVVIEGNRPVEAEELKQELQAQYPHVELSVSYFGPVIGTHLGEGSIGLSWYIK
ncbi:DegV family protein [Aquibacillus koreensis]|uniref:DegV family protein n=1 Tax=Aquibacillus koreensis TaxID=279446 RepID=A0A9X3WQN8_9BACI|nr:DegV family protein [Aquibacillus koreensis]MCT2537246.1 DegV family protein [Aquibacillus koreensis]MDC3421594.1 DegV family protein [Aquibacillus koreensis]